MRSFLAGLPNADLPDPTTEADRSPVPTIPPDDEDLIRPSDEDELLRVHFRDLTGGRPAALAKYLIWTFGPDHAALPFPLQLRTEIEDALIIACDPEIGWLHQGLEKRLEGASFRLGSRIVSRINPTHGIAPRLAYILATERLFGVADDIPTSALLWRTLLLELERVRAHVGVLIRVGTATRGDLASLESTHRRIGVLLDASAYGPGGFIPQIGGAQNLEARAHLPLREQLSAALAPLTRVHERERRSAALTRQLRGKGVVTLPMTRGFALGGPALRAAGVYDDIRASDPYFSYDAFSPRMLTAEGGDAAARVSLRLEEAIAAGAAALRLLKTFAEALDEDRDRAPIPLSVDDQGNLLPPAGRALGAVEAPSGPLSVFLVSDGTERPVRVRISSAAFRLAAALREILAGAHLDDVIPIIHSLGLEGPEIDR